MLVPGAAGNGEMVPAGDRDWLSTETLRLQDSGDVHRLKVGLLPSCTYVAPLYRCPDLVLLLEKRVATAGAWGLVTVNTV